MQLPFSRIFSLCLCLYLVGSSNAFTVKKRLESTIEVIRFTCPGDYPGDNHEIQWRLNGNNLPDELPKYEYSGTSLRINGVKSTDEGNYTCQVDGNTEQSAGQLLVYGKAEFADHKNHLYISPNATIIFNLTLKFSGAGPSMNNQTVSRYCLKRNTRDPCLVSWTHTNFNSGDDNRWSLIQEGPFFVLEQAEYNDSGYYIATVDVVDPHNNEVDDRNTRSIHVKDETCGDFPVISYGSYQTTRSPPHVNGAVVKYSCNSGCKLQGSSSLRCWIRYDSNFRRIKSWVNESNQINSPICLCPSIGVTATITATKPSDIFTSPKSSPMIRSQVVSPTNVIIATKNSADDSNRVLIISILVGVVVLLVSAILAVMIFAIRHFMMKKKTNALKQLNEKESVQQTHITAEYLKSQKPQENHDNVSSPNTSYCDRQSMIEDVDLSDSGNSNPVLLES